MFVRKSLKLSDFQKALLTRRWDKLAEGPPKQNKEKKKQERNHNVWYPKYHNEEPPF